MRVPIVLAMDRYWYPLTLVSLLIRIRWCINVISQNRVHSDKEKMNSALRKNVILTSMHPYQLNSLIFHYKLVPSAQNGTQTLESKTWVVIHSMVLRINSPLKPHLPLHSDTHIFLWPWLTPKGISPQIHIFRQWTMIMHEEDWSIYEGKCWPKPRFLESVRKMR